MDYNGFQNLIEGLASGEKNTAAEVRTLFKHLIQSIYLPGDIKEVNCTQDEINTCYDATGLGIGMREGWAICNGLNGTRPRAGRVGIGYGDGYSEIGGLGGSNKVTLKKENIPELDATLPVSNADNGGGEKTYIMATDTESAGTKTYLKTINKSSENRPINVMQSHVISLFIQKI